MARFRGANSRRRSWSTCSDPLDLGSGLPVRPVGPVFRPASRLCRVNSRRAIFLRGYPLSREHSDRQSRRSLSSGDGDFSEREPHPRGGHTPEPAADRARRCDGSADLSTRAQRTGAHGASARMACRRRGPGARVGRWDPTRVGPRWRCGRGRSGGRSSGRADPGPECRPRGARRLGSPDRPVRVFRVPREELYVTAGSLHRARA